MYYSFFIEVFIELNFLYLPWIWFLKFITCKFFIVLLLWYCKNRYLCLFYNILPVCSGSCSCYCFINVLKLMLYSHFLITYIYNIFAIIYAFVFVEILYIVLVSAASFQKVPINIQINYFFLCLIEPAFYL